MAEERIEARPAVEGEAPPARRLVLDMPSWLPLERLPRPLLIGGAAVLILALVVGIGLVPLLLGVDQDDLETLGYPGIFVATFLGTATLFFPVPGLTAAGQALVVAGGETLNPVAVVAVAAAGMTLAETTAYAAGAIGRGVAEERQMPVGGRLGEWLRRAAGWVDWLMARYGFVTLMVLAGVPNPLFEFAGITAGAVRMNFWRFLLAVGIGKTARAILLVIVGNALLDVFQIDWFEGL